jgi:2-phosphoglycerate kinase
MSRFIRVRDRGGLPYSKGLLANSLMATGLDPSMAFDVALRVEDELRGSGITEVSRSELRDVATKTLEELVDSDHADRYRTWQGVRDHGVPVIVLLGGVPGVGKSTVATMVAARLGITRVISTDTVREVMRSMTSENLVPTLYVSSFKAGDVISQDLPNPQRTLIGYREQVRAISAAIDAIIGRSIIEGTNLIVEGTHIVPGSVRESHRGDAVVVEALLSVSDPQIHRSHFEARDANGGARTAARYIEDLDAIRRIDSHLVEQAQKHDVAVFDAFDLDQTVSEVTQYIVRRAVEILAPPNLLNE